MVGKNCEEQKRFFSKTLDNLICSKGIMKSDLAKYLGVGKSSVSSWLNGSNIPRYDKLSKMAQYFGVSISDLLGESYTEMEDEYSRACAELGMVDDIFCEMVVDYYHMSTEQKNTIKDFYQKFFTLKKD